jgi:hypothetical protein
MSEMNVAINERKLIRVVAVIPTTSIFQIWEKVQNKFDVIALELRVRKQNPVNHVQINPFIKMDIRTTSEDLMCNYIKKIHGEYDLGDICYIIQKEGFSDALIKRITISDNGTCYTFTNAKAPAALVGYVTKIRRKYLKSHGLPPRPQYLYPRILKLFVARSKLDQISAKTRKTHVDPYVLYTDKTFNYLAKKYGSLFCKVLETDEKGIIIRTKVEGVEETVWW